MEKIKINFGNLRSYEELLNKENSSISLNTLQNMVNTVTSDSVDANSIAYLTLLDLNIIETAGIKGSGRLNS